ncbi:ComF family protein [Patescibacteria group bacterium]|nr:ComF family protein [Patescibacteria group bacterium]
MKFKLNINKIINATLILLFPIECIGCNKEDAYLCDKCFLTIPLHEKVEPFEHPLQYVDEIWTATDYQNNLVQTAIHHLKFRHIKELAQPLSRLLIEFYDNATRPATDDSRFATRDLRYSIIPVPLNKKRLLERDFNQSELIGKLFSDYFGFELLADAVKRTRNTPHQVGLNKKQRQTNLKDAFIITKPDLIKNENIILIDDVVTTGSTLEEIAKALKENGAQRVMGLIAAKD